MKKIPVIFTWLLFFTVLFAVPSFAGTWQEDDSGTVYVKDDGTQQGEGWFVQDGSWYYMDKSGHLLKSAITPDGYYVDIKGVYSVRKYDSMVGTYSLVSEKKSGTDTWTDAGSSENGAVCTLTVKNVNYDGVLVSQDNLLNLTESWTYPNGGLLRSWTQDYMPTAEGTFYQIYYLSKNGNTSLFTNQPKYSSDSKMTADGEGRITLTYLDSNGTYSAVFKKQ